ncbi:FKBP-type peptidyl-prolyl cis-trans isomerase [Pyxidicoccus fallax]|uniref:Peptidyl-prolyl cis-trans isomerase n=1 Tax=Pyxidicoccus fallax TaxID=394095 RepID=A0A848LG56_9BACT|nr:FKBP-type peptidyl-prolyl cis-trans isomerase [Pyxidicoccus fallax]NMO14768.1 FKBP-type peptidyl-prolyl cis-trans isomerase [Pyxidicoccus fallax]NPC84793.1 FKBP-type peptidyl-prolyl cis-trans isomerase [Pyxidicoccus fallax]
MLRSLLLGTLIVPLLVACGDDSKGNPENGDPTKVTYADSLNVNLADMEVTARGVYYDDLPVGTGAEATRFRRVRVHYTGYLPNGTRFDSSEGGPPIAFTLGSGEVIDGWDEGLLGKQNPDDPNDTDGIKVGGRRRLIIPASLAYGEDGVSGVIPPYSVLIFDTELMSVD